MELREPIKCLNIISYLGWDDAKVLPITNSVLGHCAKHALPPTEALQSILCSDIMVFYRSTR